jgi:ACS family pantothenate transporter-like MFS transporter
MYWSNYLNRANFTNAYVSGMKEDLHFKGNEYSQVNVVFTIGYIVGQIPNNLMLQIVPAHLWLPAMSFLWGGLSACTAAAKTPQHIMVIRFFQALCESSTFSGTHYILGSWYLAEELGKRSAIFSSSAQLGTLFSGVMQGSILKTLNGHAGLKAWQWLFILDFIIAIPIAVYGFLCFPGTPLKGRRGGSWFLNSAEQQLAIDRLPPTPKTKLSMDLFKRVLGRWHWYAFSALFGISSMLESVGINGLIQLWLATEPRVSEADRSYYALGAVAVAITSTYIASWVTDYTRNRWPVNVVMASALIFVSGVLLSWPTSFGFKFFAFTISGLGYMGQSTNFVWCNTVIRNDDQERAVVLASMNMWSNVINAWWGITFFPAESAPRFHKGWIATVCAAVATVAIAYTTRLFEKREQRKEQSTVENDAMDVERRSSVDDSKTEEPNGPVTDKLA